MSDEELDKNEEEIEETSEEEEVDLNNPLAIAEGLRKNLMVTDISEKKEELVEELKNLFVANRMETASLQEQVRAAALVSLMEKVKEGKMSAQQLMRVVEMTSQSGEKDLAALTGGGKAGIVINNTSQTANIGQQPPQGAPQLEDQSSANNPIQNTGFLLDAVASVVKKLKEPEAQETAHRIIDVTPTKDDE